MLKMNFWEQMGAASRDVPATCISTNGSRRTRSGTRRSTISAPAPITSSGDAGGERHRQRGARHHRLERRVRRLSSLVIEHAQMAKSYLVYFGDIYLSNARLLPDFDMVTLFHVGEFFSPNTTSEAYGGVDDLGLRDLFTAKMQGRRAFLFYRGSFGFDKAQPIIAALGEGAARARRRFQDAVGVPQSRVKSVGRLNAIRHRAARCRSACRRHRA